MAETEKPDIDRVSLRMESIWRVAEQRIMADIIRRIKKTGEITSTADYQINRLIEMGKSTEEIERIIKEALGLTWPEMFELYDKVANWQYVRSRDVYEQVNGHFVPPEDNEWLKQASAEVKKQTQDELSNIAQSHGFSVMMGGRRVFMPFSEYYQRYVDAAIMDILSGGFDYNTVIRRVVTQMTNSGLRTVDYATGHSSRVDVAVRRSVLTGIGQLTAQVNERNASELDTEYFEVSWHPGARPDHQKWQGKVYSKDELRSVCGLGKVTGLCGANCRHDYYPYIPGVSERLHTDKWLEEQNRKEAQTKEWNGKQLNLYEQTQQQRKMETAMRAQREKVELLKEAGADPDEIMIARAKYQAQLNEYAQFSRKMGLPEQRERIYQDMRGRVAPSKDTYKQTAAEAREKYGRTSDLENLTMWGDSKEKERITGKEGKNSAAVKDSVSYKKNGEILNRARKIRSEADLQQVSKSSIINMKNHEEIVEYFKNAHDITVAGFEKKDLFEAKATLAGYDDFLAEFPEAKERIRKIVYNPKLKVCGNIRWNGLSEVGPSGLKDYGTGVHEAAHGLDFAKSRFNTHSYSENIVETARKNLKLRANSKEYMKLRIELTGSVDDAKKPHEVFAYAMESKMGGPSNKLSQEIYGLAKEGE